MSISADFRARRERCGLTQQEMADAVGVRVLAVKKWERPGGPVAPADAWEFLEAVETARRAVVKQAEEAALQFAERGAVQLTYYRTQEQFDEYGRDEGPFGVANANARAVADRLESMGFEIAWAYPDDPDNIYHGGNEMKKLYVVQIRERNLYLDGSGDVHDGYTYPDLTEHDAIYEGYSVEEARAAAEEYAAANPCKFEELPCLSAIVEYWSIECFAMYEEDEEDVCEDVFEMTTLTEEARKKLFDYANGIDDLYEDMGW